MPDQRTWLIDFDDTLASGNITHALGHTFPKFMREHGLTADPQRLQAVLLDLQKRMNQNPDVAPLLQELFETMGWSLELREPFFNDLWNNSKPALFDDALPFLRRLRAHGDRVLIVSNSPRTPEQVQLLGLQPLVDGVFTPKLIPNTFPKPHRSLWDYVVTQHVDLTPDAAAIVGDDPWSDGAFADACGLPCWIVDRSSRFSELRAQKPYRWVQSLAEIVIE